MHAMIEGGRILFEPAAIAYDPQSLTIANERRRKKRTLAGNFQMLFRYLSWLSPIRNRLWWQLISHKYLRLLVPMLLMLCLVSNAVLVNTHMVYVFTLTSQMVLYTLAIVGLLFRFRSFKLFSIPAGFLYLQILCVMGFFHFLKSRIAKKAVGW